MAVEAGEEGGTWTTVLSRRARWWERAPLDGTTGGVARKAAAARVAAIWRRCGGQCGGDPSRVLRQGRVNWRCEEAAGGRRRLGEGVRTPGTVSAAAEQAAQNAPGERMPVLYIYQYHP
eukprot:7378898-Prymnesium_polylepis.1